MNRSGKWLLIGVGVVVSSAWAQSDPRVDAAGQWRLVQLRDRLGTEMLVRARGAVPTLEIGRADAGHGQVEASGNGGCNRFRGTVTFDGMTVRVGPLASTRKLCAPGVMAVERRYLLGLETVRTVLAQRDQLILSAGSVRLVFRR